MCSKSRTKTQNQGHLNKDTKPVPLGHSHHINSFPTNIPFLSL